MTIYTQHLYIICLHYLIIRIIYIDITFQQRTPIFTSSLSHCPLCTGASNNPNDTNTTCPLTYLFLYVSVYPPYPLLNLSSYRCLTLRHTCHSIITPLSIYTSIELGVPILNLYPSHVCEHALICFSTVNSCFPKRHPLPHSIPFHSIVLLLLHVPYVHNIIPLYQYYIVTLLFPFPLAPSKCACIYLCHHFTLCLPPYHLHFIFFTPVWHTFILQVIIPTVLPLYSYSYSQPPNPTRNFEFAITTQHHGIILYVAI